MKPLIRAGLAALLVTASLVGLGASPAQATNSGISDAAFDNDPHYNGRGDITFSGATYADNLVTLALKVRNPQSPASWAAYSTGMLWYIDVTGDGTEDYKVFAGVTSFGIYSSVTDVDLNDICDAALTSDGTQYYVQFPAGCIGNPSQFSHNVFMTYDDGSDMSTDSAPDDIFAFCCTVTETVTPPPSPNPPISTATGPGGYWMITAAGGVHAFGPAPNLGSVSATAADLESTPSGKGYWVLTTTGGVLNKGDAGHFGDSSTKGGMRTGETATSLSAMPGGDGYWIFTSLGRVLNFGAAPHLGDMIGVVLQGAVQDSVATPSGGGYYMVASDGGIFAFGNADYVGSMGGALLNKPVMSMAPDPDGDGYWLVASDGGIFAFHALYYGSMGATKLNRPVTGMVAGSSGYMMVGEDGGIFAFGNVAYHGSLGSNPPASPVVAVALRP